ncbi:MAG: hypothetical protein Kow00128_00330 [Deltaproteobacteria bacterium]
MKISGRNGERPKRVEGKKIRNLPASSASTGSPGTGKSEGPETTVSISSQGRIVSEARILAGELPEVRTERVEEIRSAVDGGTYRVQGEKVARKMVDDAVREIRNRYRSG